jgi:hypothetical protein
MQIFPVANKDESIMWVVLLEEVGGWWFWRAARPCSSGQVSRLRSRETELRSLSQPILRARAYKSAQNACQEKRVL